MLGKAEIDVSQLIAAPSEPLLGVGGAGGGPSSGGLGRTGVGPPPFGMSGAGGRPSSDGSGPTGVGQPPLVVGGAG